MHLDNDFLGTAARSIDQRSVLLLCYFRLYRSQAKYGTADESRGQTRGGLFVLGT